MVGKQVVTKDQLDAFARKLRQAVSGASVTNVYQSGETITNFTELADVPQSYIGYAGHILAVNAGESAVEFNNYVLLNASAPTLTIRNKTDSEVDPVLQWAVGATPVVKFTAGVDDSDGDAWKLSAGSALGTNDRIVVTATPRIGLFTASPLAPIHYITPAPGSLPDIILEETMAEKALQLRLKNYGRSWDIVSDNLPDRFGFYDVTGDITPFFIQGATGNIGLWWENLATWEAATGSFGTGSPAKIISLKDDSVWPTNQSTDQLCIGGFSIKSYSALGILSGNEIASYFGSCWFLNDTSNTDMNRGATLNCGAYEDQILAFKYSFDNGFSDLVEIDTFADFRVNTANGGLEINSYSAAAVARGDYSFYTTPNATLGTAGYASHTLYSAKAYVGSYGNCGATDNIFTLRPYIGDGWNSCLIFNASGTGWQRGSHTIEGGLTVGLNGAGGTAAVITLRDGANPGTTATLTYAKWASLQGVTGVVKGDGAGAFSAAALDDLSDINAAAPNDNDVLSWDSATSRWIAVVPSAGAAAFLDLTDVNEADYVGHAGEFVIVNGTADGLIFTASSAAAHDILSLTHGDTTAAAVVRGDIIIGSGATPTWTRLAKGNAGEVLTMGANEPAWSAASAGAPTDAQYVVLALNGSLSAERVLTAGAGVALADGGANGNATLTTTAVFKHLVEIFDGLATGAINGLGSYYQCGTWTDASSATCTTTVAVKAGADKMLRCSAPAGAGTASANLTLSSTIGLSGGCRFRWKMRTDQVAANYSGGLLIANAAGTTVASCRFRNATTYKIQFYDGTTYTDLVNPAAANTWYTIDMIISDLSITTGVARIWVDGVYVTSAATATHAAEWDTIKCYCTNAGAGALNIDYDDLQVYGLMPLFTEL